MLNEWEEFRAYTEQPTYTSTGKRDTAYLGRFTFDMLLERFDDILADALELGALRNNSISFSAEGQKYIADATPDGVPPEVVYALIAYYIANRPEDSDWVVLPVSDRLQRSWSRCGFRFRCRLYYRSRRRIRWCWLRLGDDLCFWHRRHWRGCWFCFADNIMSYFRRWDLNLFFFWYYELFIFRLFQNFEPCGSCGGRSRYCGYFPRWVWLAATQRDIGSGRRQLHLLC